MITFSNVSKTYINRVDALSDVSFDIQRGEMVFLTGASGAGKTTIAKLILREERATSGNIKVNGFDLSKLKKRKEPYYRRTIGIVFQDFKLLPNCTAFENLSFIMRIVGANKKQIGVQVPEVLEQVGLNDKMDAFPSELSGGEQQRLAIARAIINMPDIVIADEPTGNLDFETSMGIMDLFSDIYSKGTTVLIITHDQVILEKLNKRVLLLQNGKLISDEERYIYEN